MSFKIHLIIISCIIIAMTLSWEFMHNSPTQPDTAPAKLQHSLSITHASWGLNCRDIVVNSDTTQNAFLNKHDGNSRLHEDNVLGTVSRLCNGNMNCDVPVDESSLGSDPAPACPSKVLEIEYRCFSYDRPWIVKISSGTASLHCDQPDK